MMAGCRLGSGGGGESVEGFLTRFGELRALGRDSIEIYNYSGMHGTKVPYLQTTKLKSSRCGILMRSKK